MDEGLTPSTSTNNTLNMLQISKKVKGEDLRVGDIIQNPVVNTYCPCVIKCMYLDGQILIHSILYKAHYLIDRRNIHVRYMSTEIFQIPELPYYPVKKINKKLLLLNT